MTENRPVKLLERLSELNIARKQLADAAGVTERTVYRWLNYDMEPKLTLDRVACVCSLLGWNIQQLAEAYYPPDESPPMAVESGGDNSPK
jgi:DNA-binding XRE family transcriptional regulator